MDFKSAGCIRKLMTLGCAFVFAIALCQCSKSPMKTDQVAEKPVMAGNDVTIYDPSEIGTRTCEDGVQPGGALYRMCLPERWNGDLVLYAHGYVDPREPLEIPDDEVGEQTVSEIINLLGYAFAATSYRANGLVVPDAVEDVVELVHIFQAEHGDPEHVYLVGASEGGLVTTLALEQYPDLFSGGLAACGPVGDFRLQINYFGHFRVVFDYFFPGVLPGSPVDIPQELIDGWSSMYEQVVLTAIRAHPEATEQLIRVTGAPVDPWDSSTIEETVLGALRYNVFATNNAVMTLGGQPFDNSKHIYFGSDHDFRLNRKIERIRADQRALDEIEARYQTSGDLDHPLVTIHTLSDEIVPYWHEPLYRWKIFQNGSGLLHANIPVCRYGHCNFKVAEVLAAFAVVVFKVTLQELIVPERIFPDIEELTEFLELAQRNGIQPTITAGSVL
jgi:pimeloyl-ACP methyl ester carboxylesterase